jgi:hypothetical protein
MALKSVNKRAEKDAAREEKAAAMTYPKGTVFARKRGQYAGGMFYAAGSVSAPLEKPGKMPGLGWKVHFSPERNPGDDTLSGAQHKVANRPPGA